jgi:hypothetical protein
LEPFSLQYRPLQQFRQLGDVDRDPSRLQSKPRAAPQSWMTSTIFSFGRDFPYVCEALTALGLAVFVSGILGVLIYLGADALMEFLFL